MDLSEVEQYYIPRQCVADRAPVSHLVNLFDMDSKYGDVMDVEEVRSALARHTSSAAVHGR